MFGNVAFSIDCLFIFVDWTWIVLLEIKHARASGLEYNFELVTGAVA